MAYICIMCKNERESDAQFRDIPCPGRQGHVLQEKIIGARHPDTHEIADFIPVGPDDIKHWVERAKKLGFTLDDE
jgi:hypothetical protein